ncbi:fimbrial protein [Serratia ureilytica]|uniref:fimbrial protein n=1 Tax=Serratia ureilytica TaxID=300181 RepID=UPI0033162AE1
MENKILGKRSQLRFAIVGCAFFMLSLSLDVKAALTCINNCSSNYTATLNKNLGNSENGVGHAYDSNEITIPRATFSFSGSSGPYSVWMRFEGEPVPTPGFYTTQYKYHKVNDYISVGVSWGHPCYGNGRIYAPFNYAAVSVVTCSVQYKSPGDVGDFEDKQVEASVRIDRKIVTGTYSKNILIAQVGFCHPGPCQSAQFVRNIYLNVNITVPQSCELNAGQVININFGNISSGAFKTAGVGAQGVKPQSRNVSVRCDNVAGNAQLTMRLQADKTNGNVVVSDENNDVGFRVTNNSGVPLIPNNLSSVIPFTLDSNARQNVTIQAYPVSVTGNKPAEGPVTSRAYLRVDFP